MNVHWCETQNGKKCHSKVELWFSPEHRTGLGSTCTASHGLRILDGSDVGGWGEGPKWEFVRKNEVIAKENS